MFEQPDRPGAGARPDRADRAAGPRRDRRRRARRRQRRLRRPTTTSPSDKVIEPGPQPRRSTSTRAPTVDFMVSTGKPLTTVPVRRSGRTKQRGRGRRCERAQLRGRSSSEQESDEPQGPGRRDRPGRRRAGAARAPRSPSSSPTAPRRCPTSSGMSRPRPSRCSATPASCRTSVESSDTDRAQGHGHPAEPGGRPDRSRRARR